MGSLGEDDHAAMAVWETEDESGVRAAAMLPTPADTPYRTPSRSSKKSRRSLTPDANKNPTPTPVPGEKLERSSKRSSRDVTTDENISILDPRRFTPTLHANLVSEILALRRDQEEKLKIIEGLESSLHATKEEQEAQQTTLQATAKESRSLKRQLALLEGGTSSALGELARERDEAVEATAEAKKRLDAAQKKLRSQEEDSERVHDLLAKEKDSWDEERRKYDRKIHVAESRLKLLLDEVAILQQQQQQQQLAAQNAAESEADNDAASMRTMSMTNSIRFSVMSGPNGGMVRPNGLGNSLADELNFDGDDDYETDRGCDSVMSNYPPPQQQQNHMRNQSRDSLRSMRMGHRRNPSSDSLMRPGSVARGRFVNASVLERLEDVVIQEDDKESSRTGAVSPSASPAKSVRSVVRKPSRTYKDSGVQFSPPPSPKLQPVVAKPITVIPAQPSHEPPPPPIPARAPMRAPEQGDAPARETQEVEANQRRKRIHIARPLTIAAVVNHNAMVSAGSQTVEPPSPPRTPISPVKEEPKIPSPVKVQKVVAPPMVSTSTQTDAIPEPPPKAEPAPAELPSLSQLMQIPSISIHPPTSRPTTPREPRLPQLFKDFGCQVSLISAPVSASYVTVAIQTEEIRVDKRLDRLPLHLHPSSITSRPGSPAAPTASTPAPAALPEEDPKHQQQFTPVPGNLPPPRNPRRLTSKRSLEDIPASPVSVVSLDAFEETHDAYPGNNDDGPLSSQKAPLRRPHRISSLFAGFDGGSSDEADEFAEGDLSDSEFRTALSAPRPKAGSSKSAGKRPVASATAAAAWEAPPVPKQAPSRTSVRSMGPTETYSKFSIPDGRDGGHRSSMQGAGLGGGMGSRTTSHDKLPGPSSNRSSVMRKAAMIQSGIASHQGRARSPSLPQDPVRDPPFPIPTRASSRRPVGFTASAPSDGQRSPTRRMSARSGASRTNSIRKVRSAAALPRGGNPRYRRQASRSPPPFSPATTAEEMPESPGLPPLPNNDITTPRTHNRGMGRYGGGGFGNQRYSRHQHQSSTTNTADTEATTGYAASAATGGGAAAATQASGVVDAIAQTMVGEWMFKYVRRRKSFGVADAGGGRDDSSNDRHKRWVWLAPYERAILWSSKQPVSGSALMGKAGRKLTIQSVLDVKDDNAPPKGVAQLFNRSILILTPQRALKFTAVNSERHYLWLTALSFLAHSSQEVPEILASPLAVPSTSSRPKPLPDFELAQKPRRPGIRDSIRLAKGKTALVATRGTGGNGGGTGLTSISSAQTDAPSMPSIPSSYHQSRPAGGHASVRAESVVSSSAATTSHTGAVGGGNQYHHVGTFSSHRSSMHQREYSREAAEPPLIPRFHDRPSFTERANQTVVHGRKRSNTGGHVPPPLSFRGFSGPLSAGPGSVGSSSNHRHGSTNSTAGASIDTTGSSGIFQSQASSSGAYGHMNNNLHSQGGFTSQRTSEASSRPSGAAMNNFFDAIGTVRMEAFISPLAHSSNGGAGGGSCFDDYPDEQEEMRYRARRRSKELRRRASRSRHRDRDSYNSRSGTREEPDFFRDDPFRGF